MSVSAELGQRSFFARAMQRIAAAFAARAETAGHSVVRDVDRATTGEGNVFALRPSVAPIDQSVATEVASTSTTTAEVATTTSLIGFAVAGGAVARLPLEPSISEHQTQESGTPSAAARTACDDSDVACTNSKRAIGELETFLPRMSATVPALGLVPEKLANADLVEFFGKVSLRDKAPTSEPIAMPAIVDRDEASSVEPALRQMTPVATRPLAAQRAATSAMNRPMSRAALGKSSAAKSKKAMPKKVATTPKRAPSKRHVALVARCIGATKAWADVPVPQGETVIEPMSMSASVKSTMATQIAAPTRRIDLSVPAVRGALRLEREGRNSILSLPIAA